MDDGGVPRRDPRAVLLWLRRLQASQAKAQAAKRKANPKALSNLFHGYIAGAVAFLVMLILASIVLIICGMDPKRNGDAYGAALSLPSLAAGIAALILTTRRRARRAAAEHEQLERQLRAEADEFAASFPDTVRDLFRTKEDLLNPAALADAIRFAEQLGTAPAGGLAAPAPPRPLAAQGAPCAGQIVGGCRLIRKLGEGGMGAVYQAHHLGLDIPVAVKILPPAFVERNADAVSRFLGEARAAAKLKHPHIVGVYNVGCEAGIHFIVMELVEGGSLQDVLRTAGRLPLRRTVELLAQVCQGLQAAHDQGIIHRDIKPANILIDSTGAAKIADLGLAKRTDDELGVTVSGMAMGTPLYLSPEQARDAKHVDARTDLYSLGCMTYEMLCGKVPYEGDTWARILLAHAQAPVPDPRAANPAVPDRLADLVMRMMAKSPDERPASASAILGELRAMRN
jgi:hypothetical protein